jgi:hypothetical protein
MSWLNPSSGRVVVTLCLLALTSGCGSGRSTVTGRVTYGDGSPVEGGTVIGEANVEGETVTVQGRIAKNGSFSLGGAVPGDGALPGTYRVVVMPRALGEGERARGKVPAVAGRFTRFETSGITCEVKTGKTRLDITVTRPEPKTVETVED